MKKKTKRSARPKKKSHIAIAPSLPAIQRMAAAPVVAAAPPPQRRENPVWFFGFAAAFIIVVVFAAAPPSVAEVPPSIESQPEVKQIGQTIIQQGHPMDEPLRLLATARESFAGVHDYSCTMVKQERIKGQLHPPHVVQVSIRNEPFSVAMKWTEPKCMAGQEACYVAGQNNGQMRVKSSGMLAKLGFISLDVNDPRTRKTSNHSITEAGIANLLRRYTDRWEAAKAGNNVRVKMGEYEYNKRRCMRVETIVIEHREDCPYHRNVVFFDCENHLPVRVECYDWPSDANGAGELIEVYNYMNVQLNANLPDETFVH